MARRNYEHRVHVRLAADDLELAKRLGIFPGSLSHFLRESLGRAEHLPEQERFW